jgi:hypothetical protein
MPTWFRMGAALTACLISSSVFAQARATAIATSRSDFNELRAWDQRIDSLIRSRDLVVRESMRDTMLPERSHERLDQYSRKPAQEYCEAIPSWSSCRFPMATTCRITGK